MSRRPEAVALEELAAAIVEYLAGAEITVHHTAANARLTLALNAARNALQMGRVLDGIAADPDIVRGHVGSVG